MALVDVNRSAVVPEPVLKQASSKPGALRLFRTFTSPNFTVTITWALSLIMYIYASNAIENLRYFRFMVYAERLTDESTFESFFWIFVAFVTFSFGTLVAKYTFRNVSKSTYTFVLDPKKASQYLIYAFVFTFAVAFIWIFSAVQTVGGVLNLAALAASENTVARDAVLGAAFPGGRLISSGFVGIALYAAVLFIDTSKRKGNLRVRTTSLVIFLVAMAYLALIPVLVSGRINFFIACIGSFVAATLVNGKVLGSRHLLLGLGAMVFVWIIKENLRLGHVMEDVSALDQGFQGLVFYFYNDLLNALNTVGHFDGHNTLGWYSMRFVFFFTFTDDTFARFIAEDTAYYAQWISAGEVPFLSAPLVDFGLAGLFLLFGMGMLTQLTFEKAKHHITYKTLYGIVFACLLLSTHSSYITSQEVVYSSVLIAMISSRAKVRK